MNKKIVLFMFIFFILISVSYSAPPTTVIPVESGQIEIRSVVNTYHPLGTGHYCPFFAFNQTGHKLDNTTTDCFIKSYDPDDNVLCNEKLPYNGENFYINVTADFFPVEGIYSYVVWCNNSKVGGSLSGSINVNKLGYEPQVDYYDFIVPGFILLAIAGMFFYLAYKMDKNLKEIKLIFFYLGLVFILGTLFYGLKVSSIIPFSENFTTIFIVLISVYIIILILLVFLQWTDKLKDAVNNLIGTK